MQLSNRLAVLFGVLALVGAPLRAGEFAVIDPIRRGQQTRCFAQQRILSGYLKLLELRRGERLTSLPWTVLLRNPRLRKLARDPGASDPRTSYQDYQLSASAPLGIMCTRHGHEALGATPAVTQDVQPPPPAPPAPPPPVREVGFLGL